MWSFLRLPIFRQINIHPVLPCSSILISFSPCSSVPSWRRAAMTCAKTCHLSNKQADYTSRRNLSAANVSSNHLAFIENAPKRSRQPMIKWITTWRWRSPISHLTSVHSTQKQKQVDTYSSEIILHGGFIACNEQRRHRSKWISRPVGRVI